MNQPNNIQQKISENIAATMGQMQIEIISLQTRLQDMAAKVVDLETKLFDKEATKE